MATLTFFFQQQNLNWVLIEADYDHYNHFRITSHVILYLLIHESYITESFLVVIDMDIFSKEKFLLVLMQNNCQICYLVLTLKLFPNFILKYFKPLKLSELYVQFNKQQYVLLPNL